MTEHVHQWMIGQPQDGVSVGVCACGATREFIGDFAMVHWRRRLLQDRKGREQAIDIRAASSAMLDGDRQRPQRQTCRRCGKRRHVRVATAMCRQCSTA